MCPLSASCKVLIVNKTGHNQPQPLAYRINREIGMRVESLLCITIKDRLQPRRVCQAEYTKTENAEELISLETSIDRQRETYLGVDLGAQTTAKDSGSMR